MFKKFSKRYLLASLAFLSMSAMPSSVMADDCCYTYDSSCCPCPCDTSRIYIGGFGGMLFPTAPKLNQTGVAFFSEITPPAIGPLSVDARGRSNKKDTGYGGVQVGYEFNSKPCFGSSDWSFAGAGELEAIFYSHTKKGILENPISVLAIHDFAVKFPMDIGVYLVGGVMSLKSNCMWGITPYIGAGVGAARISINKADSLQIDPAEPGVNHFNNRDHDSTWTFAAQAKAGLRYNIWERFHVFAEYRFLYLDSSKFNFGSTVTATHVPTTTWDVRVNNIYYNAFAVGIQIDL